MSQYEDTFEGLCEHLNAVCEKNGRDAICILCDNAANPTMMQTTGWKKTGGYPDLHEFGEMIGGCVGNCLSDVNFTDFEREAFWCTLRSAATFWERNGFVEQ